MEGMKKYIIEIIVIPLVFAIDALIIAEFLPVEWLKEHKILTLIGSSILILGIIFIFEFSRRKKERKEKIERLKALEEEKTKELKELEEEESRRLKALYSFIEKSSINPHVEIQHILGNLYGKLGSLKGRKDDFKEGKRYYENALNKHKTGNPHPIPCDECTNLNNELEDVFKNLKEVEDEIDKCNIEIIDIKKNFQAYAK